MITVVIVAGGSGTRMKSEMPKQFINLNGIPILMHTIRKFNSFNPEISIRLVLPIEQIELWEQLCVTNSFNVPHTIYSGGESRFHSVKNGLKGLSDDGYVAVHDGVRPLVSDETLKRCFDEVKVKGSVIPVIEVFETLREIKGVNSKTVPRSSFRLVQTPQVFKADLLQKAYLQDYNTEFTDDASVVEFLGHEISLVEGNRENIKITTPIDLLVAETYLKSL